jgi:hypothetical protein
MAAGVLALASAACGSTLMNRPAQASAEEWQIVVSKVVDGPDSVSYHNINHEAVDGERFLHVHLVLKNMGNQTRKWNWPRCDLDHGGDAYLPSIYMYDMIINAPANEVEEVDPGEELARRIIFTYPEGGALPTRLRCGDVVVALQLSDD